VLALLIQAGAEVNAQDYEGATALMKAAKEPREVIDFLLSRGADISIKDNNGCAKLYHTYDNLSRARYSRVLYICMHKTIICYHPPLIR